MSSERFQRPRTSAGARSASATDDLELPPHPPDVRDAEVDAVLGAEFPMALRGYDRTAVEAYVQRASRVIAELRAGSSPQAAVRYALEQVSEETRSILQQAHDTADATTTRAREQAAEQLENAERDGAAMLENAERYAAELRASAERDAADLRAAAERDATEVRSGADQRVHDAEDELAAVWQERERLIEDAREVAARLAEIAEVAAEREVPQAIQLTEDDTEALPARQVWNDDEDRNRMDGFDDDGDRYDDQPPPPALRAVPLATPPPPEHAEPEPSLANAPPPPSDSPGALAFELRDPPDLGPLDEPAADVAVDEAAVPEGDTQEFTPVAESGAPTPDDPPHRPAQSDDLLPDEHDKSPPHGDELGPLVDDDETRERDS